ncbi:MAG: type II toxin-antitoxin system VapC family toxin, partial [Thermoleophilaceae bacterium]|nr:type II toxin-antitoxin system VapC family toxin [Thermoleophilaceae bacterium]
HEVIVPDLVDCEVLSAWRRAVRTGNMTAQRADRAVHFLSVAPLIRTTTEPLLKLIWQHRNNLSSYDATYIALAELYEIPLLTADARLAKAPNTTAKIHLLP